MTELEREVCTNWEIVELFEKWNDDSNNDDIDYNEWERCEIEYILDRCEFIEGESKEEYEETLRSVFSKVLEYQFEKVRFTY